MKLSKKITIDLSTSRFVAGQAIRATECLAWCSRDHLFSVKTTQYPYAKYVSDALEGYRGVPRFHLLELATHAWFAGRSNEVYSPHLLAIGFDDRQRCTHLSEVERKFIDKFSRSVAEDLKPIVEIVCAEFKKALPDEDDRTSDVSLFASQLASTFEWVAERHLNFQASPVIPKGMKELGEAVLVPFIDAVPHAEKQVNTVVCVTANNYDKTALESWASDVGLADPNAHHRPVLLLATRKIPEGRPLFRDCTSKLVGVTSGSGDRKLPSRVSVSSPATTTSTDD